MLEIVINVSQGFIPLWAPDVILRWRFRERGDGESDSPAANAVVRKLLGDALLAWSDAAPVRFAEDEDLWDFEIVIRPGDQCGVAGCVLASAFFPDAGRHQLNIFPKMFEQSESEQVDTLAHELGHVFGLRHFFAQVSETAFPSVVFGVHSKFSIMNYGSLSTLTQDDRDDLRRLYRLAWDGKLTEVNGTPVRFVRPYHTVGAEQKLLTVAAPTARLPSL